MLENWVLEQRFEMFSLFKAGQTDPREVGMGLCADNKLLSVNWELWMLYILRLGLGPVNRVTKFDTLSKCVSQQKTLLHCSHICFSITVFINMGFLLFD